MHCGTWPSCRSSVKVGHSFSMASIIRSCSSRTDPDGKTTQMIATNSSSASASTAQILATNSSASAADRSPKKRAADVMHQMMPPQKKATPETPTTPTSPMTLRISPLDRRSPTPKRREPIVDKRSPTPSFGARKEDKTETKKYYGDWHRQKYWPYMIDVGRNRVHAQSWWQLYRSSQYGTYYFRNNFGESLWPAA